MRGTPSRTIETPPGASSSAVLMNSFVKRALYCFTWNTPSCPLIPSSLAVLTHHSSNWASNSFKFSPKGLRLSHHKRNIWQSTSKAVVLGLQALMDLSATFHFEALTNFLQRLLNSLIAIENLYHGSLSFLEWSTRISGKKRLNSLNQEYLIYCSNLGFCTSEVQFSVL
jgi:hypothetical protein